ncbi:CvpA family protein [Chloroflexota bacterium]
MNLLDISILVILVINVFVGLRIGIIKAVLSLTGVIVGVILAGLFYVSLGERLTFIPQDGIANIVAFVIILVGVMVIASVVAALTKWVVSAVMLGWVNYLGGAVLGLALGAIFCSALLAIWVKFFGITGFISESSLAVILLDRFPAVLALLPEEFDAIRSFFQASESLY